MLETINDYKLGSADDGEVWTKSGTTSGEKYLIVAGAMMKMIFANLYRIFLKKNFYRKFTFFIIVEFMSIPEIHFCYHKITE